MIGFVAGVFFFGLFCWITAAPGHARMPSEVVFMDPDGKKLVSVMGELTGADVGASLNFIGKGGDWRLEYALGSIEAPALCIPGYLYQLANQVVTNNNDSGTGAENTIIQANASPNTATYRVFNITAGTVTLENMTIRNGNIDSTHGGGINNSATLTINNSTIFDNTASATANDTGNADGWGGGLYIGNGTVIIENSTISGNIVSATASAGLANELGAGMRFSNGSTTVLNSIIAQNTDNDSNHDYYYSGGTLTDNGYNIVEYQSGTSTGSGKTFTATTDILFNTKANGTTGYSTWNQNNSDLANQNLNLASSLADNGGSNPDPGSFFRELCHQHDSPRHNGFGRWGCIQRMPTI